MSSFLSDNLINSTFIDTIQIAWHTINTYISDITVLINYKTVLNIFESLSEYFYFNEFQWTLLKAFSIVLFINLALTFAAWKYYGKKICERFMRPATSRAIEELKASVARLKLPKEHTPRI